MEPIISKNSFILSVPFKFKKNKNQFIIFKHQKYGLLIKKLYFIDNSEKYWFIGENSCSISSNEIGPIAKEKILGRAYAYISRNTFLLKFL